MSKTYRGGDVFRNHSETGFQGHRFHALGLGLGFAVFFGLEACRLGKSTDPATHATCRCFAFFGPPDLPEGGSRKSNA